MKPEVPPETAQDDNTRVAMQKIARLVDEQLPDKWGFVVLAFPFNSTPGRMNYVANAKREDIVRSMREWLRKTEAEFATHADGANLRMTDAELMKELSEKSQLIMREPPATVTGDPNARADRLEVAYKYLICASILNNEVPFEQLKRLHP
jgi:hypothetical protein